MTRLRLLSTVLCLWLLAAAAPAYADVLQEYVFENGKTYVVKTALGITTQVALIADDEVEDFSVGFSGGWDVSRRENVLYLRPKNTDVDTNLIVRTRARTYIIDLKVVASNWKKLDQAKQAGVQYRVSFVPASATAAGARVATSDPSKRQAPAASKPRSFDPSKKYMFDYDVSASKGAEALVPANVYDDNQFTYLLLRQRSGQTGMSQPAVFARRTADGGDMIVNSHVEGDSVVVHGIYPFLALRNGKQLVLVRRNGK